LLLLLAPDGPPAGDRHNFQDCLKYLNEKTALNRRGIGTLRWRTGA